MKVMILFIKLIIFFSNETVTRWVVGGERPSVLNGHLFVEKRQNKSKTQGRDARYKLKSKLVISPRNIQHFTRTVL